MNLPCSVLHEDSFSLQLHKQLTTTQILQNEVQLAASLECIDEVDNERILYNNKQQLFTFCVSRRRHKMYCGHVRLCVCLSVCLSAAVRPHYCPDPDVTWGRGRGCPLVVHYWADLQSGHGLRCYGNITRTLVTSLRSSRDMTT